MTKHTRLGTGAEFFRKLREGSQIKQKIVSDYFVYYNRVMTTHNDKVGYADLFAGPGTYVTSDGVTHRSTPILVCEAALQAKPLRDKVHLWFNDGNLKNYNELKAAIESVPEIKTLRYAPTIHNKVVDARWAEKLAKLKAPTLIFLDPCGYKGLSLRLVASCLGGFGNDCIFFFNYSRINMKLDLEIMNESIDEFFEPERAKTLRAAIRDQSPDSREEIILKEVMSAIKEAGGIPAKFKFLSDTNRTSHYLVFASKNPNAARAMKRIFNSASSRVVEGVGSGEHDPQASRFSDSLFDGLYQVQERLLSTFGGRRIRFDALLQEESETRFTDTNYRDALLKLESTGEVTMDPPAQQRRLQAGGTKRTLPAEVYIQF